jgi:hypothetical protein
LPLNGRDILFVLMARVTGVAALKSSTVEFASRIGVKASPCELHGSPANDWKLLIQPAAARQQGHC